MNLQDIQNRFELKHLVDHFSNLADEKKVAEQMPLFAADAEVITYIGDELFAHAQGHAEIEKVFADYLAQFHTVYHLERPANGGIARRPRRRHRLLPGSPCQQ